MNRDTAEVTVSKKYARAFLNSFMSSLTYKDVQQIETVAHAMQETHSLMAFLTFYNGNDTQYQNTIVGCIKKLGFPVSMDSLIELLAHHQRLFLLPTVCHWIALYFRKKHHIMKFLVTTSHHISESDKERVDTFLKHHMGDLVEVEYVVDRALIAGLRMQSKTYLWEKSIAQQLRDVQLQNMR